MLVEDHWFVLIYKCLYVFPYTKPISLMIFTYVEFIIIMLLLVLLIISPILAGGRTGSRRFPSRSVSKPGEGRIKSSMGMAR